MGIFYFPIHPLYRQNLKSYFRLLYLITILITKEIEMRTTSQHDYSISQLAPTIEALSKNKESVNPTDAQQALLDNTKASLVEKMKIGRQFHSVEIRSYTEVIHDGVQNPNLKKTRTPDPEPLLARGVMVKNLTKDELALAKEVFGVVIQSSDGIFFPVDLAKKDKAEIVLENVSATFSNLLNDNNLAKKIAPYAVGAGGSIAMVNEIGMKAVISNSIAKYAGGVIVSPGILPILGGAAIAGAVVGSAFAVAPLAEKIKTIRQTAKDKKDGDEMEIAINAVSKIDYQTILSTERSNLLPTLAPEVDQKVVDHDRKFEKKNKLR